MTATATSKRGLRAETDSASPLWRHFAQRFRLTYGCNCPFDGSGTPFPRRTRFGAEGTWLPRADENRKALATIRAARASLAEQRRRIDRMFSHSVHVSAGVTLLRVAFWFEQLESFEAFNAATRRVYGGGAA